MPRVRAAPGGLEIAHPKWGAHWKVVSLFTRGALEDATDERLVAFCSWRPLIALAPVGKGGSCDHP